MYFHNTRRRSNPLLELVLRFYAIRLPLEASYSGYTLGILICYTIRMLYVY